jgi:Family of unknown function (DUF6308)
MSIVLRGTTEVKDPLAVALAFIEAYSRYEAGDHSGPASFDESDLRLANRGGARISAPQVAAILERREEIERALREIDPDTSLTDASASIPWAPLTQLFDAFADISGVGFSKMTKALHRKRPALIPILDSVVQGYLATDAHTPGSFGERATELVRSYKLDLDRNEAALRDVSGQLASRGHPLTEVRILDIVIWSTLAAA